MKTLSIDIETYSDQNLAKCGVYRYVESPVFEILLFSYSADGQPVQIVDLACGEKIPDEVITALKDESVTKWAFNAGFERICLSRHLGYPTGDYLDPESWRCSMIWAATMGLPLSLEGVGAVLGLEKQKLTEGKDLIKYFCQPCAPTKSNGQRTRNLPCHAPDKWLAFKKYNIRDVETEMSIQARLAKYPVPESVWDEYHIDQEINDRGVALDMELVRQAIQMDGRSRSELTQAMKELTELENPNSVQQMKLWLANNGLETDTLGKKAVAEMLKTAPPQLQTVLSLRQQLAKSSVKKYQAMETAVCSDGRARGMFQFYGANRTGRWAGRIIQMQNLPQNHLADLSEARGLVRNGDFEAVELLYEDVPDTLSQLIRTAFIPGDDAKFIVADFSAIEARVIAWIAGEEWRQKVFAEGKDIYYSDLIQNHDEWLYVGVYADEAKTGTKDSREDFQRLIADCRAGKIDMVITKSISRFARNTVTLLQTVREFKAMEVDIYFEEQNIHTMSGDGELMMTILASYAQEESRSASENQKWRIKRNFEEGMPWNGAMLGYRLHNGRYIILEDEAEIVRRIYSEYLSGSGYAAIAKGLNEDGIPARFGGQWAQSVVSKILSNYTYTGNLILQKTYRENHLTKRTVINKGQLPQYHVEESHEAIIDMDTFNAVQAEKARRATRFNRKPQPRKTYPFTGLMVCEICDKNYRRKITKTGPVWVCGTFNSMGKAHCASKQIPESTLQQITAEVLETAVFEPDSLRRLSSILVCRGNRLTFRFHNGAEITRQWKDRSRSQSWTDEMKAAARQKTLERRNNNA